MAEVTKTIKSAGGDYTGIKAWESGEQTDLVTDGDTHKVVCDAIEDDIGSSPFTLAGWTTDSSHYITIESDSGPEFPFSSTGAFTIRYTSAFSNVYAVTISQDYTRIRGLQFWEDGDNAECRILKSSCDGYLFSRCFFVNENAYTTNIRLQGDGGLVEHCASWQSNDGRAVYYVGSLGESCDIYNTLVFTSAGSGTRIGFDEGSDGELSCYNCVSFGFATDFSNVTDDDYCATDLAAGSSGLSGANSVYEITDNWEDSSNQDFSYTSGSFSDLEDAGYDYSATVADTDITGAATRGSNWDIGPYDSSPTVPTITATFTMGAEVIETASLSVTLGAEVVGEVGLSATLGAEVLKGVGLSATLGAEVLGEESLSATLGAEVVASLEAQRALGAEVLASTWTQRGLGAEHLLEVASSFGLWVDSPGLTSGDMTRATPGTLLGETRETEGFIMRETRNTMGTLQEGTRE